MTGKERLVLLYLSAIKERIECGAIRIVDAEIVEGPGDCLLMCLDPRESTYSLKSTISLEIELIPVAKRVPLKTI